MSEEGTRIEIHPLAHYLRERVSDPVLPPATATPDLLPFDQRSSEDFERICVVIAEQVDGMRDVRLYGVRGQKQEGIDLVGFDEEGAATVYQARRLAAFSLGDLRRAVQDYAAGQRPFDAMRFVVCTSSSARRTEILDELKRLTASYDFDIDLYDQERLSEMLRQRGDLVRRFFGEEWERVFCLREAVVAPAPTSADVQADALLRGPLEALGLNELAVKAQDMLASSPAEAARKYGQIAEALEASAFAGFAETYRRRQADAAIAAQDAETAVRILADIAWKDVLGGGSGLRARKSIKRLEELEEPPNGVPAAGILAGVFKFVQRWSADPFVSTGDTATRIVQLVQDGSPGAHRATLWLSESAVVSEEFSVIRESADALEAVAAARQSRSQSDELAVRVRLCLAEATGDWSELLDRTLRGRLGRRQGMLVHARHARYMAWRAEPEAADKSYRLAIDQACHAGLNSEAAAYLRSIWTVGVRYGLPDEDWFGAVDLAGAVQASGGEFLRTAYDHRAAGLHEFADGKLPSALQDLRTYLRSSIISARLAAEIDAHKLLGKLYSQAGELGLAARHYIRAGEAKSLEQVLSQAKAYVDCTEELSRWAPWERATSLCALAAEGDLVPDVQVDDLARGALERTSGDRQSHFAPLVWVSAYKLLAALAERLPKDLIDPLLDRLEPQIEREANKYRRNDDEHVQIVADLFLRHPGSRDRTGPHLLALMAASPELGRRVLGYGWHAIEAGKEILTDGLDNLATEGCRAALDALLYLEEDHPLLISEAKRLMTEALTPAQRTPGRHSIGSELPRIAVFVRLLPEDDRIRFAGHCMDVAEDTSEMEPNRADALGAVMTVASDLQGSATASLFQRAMALATAPGFSEADRQLKASLHPLSAFRFDIGFGSLVPRAVRAAASLARKKEEFQQVVGSAWALFRQGDEFAANQAAHALALIPASESTVDPRILAGSPDRWARQLAIFLWRSRPDEAPELGQVFAADHERSVRETLVASLEELRTHRPDLADELRTVLSQDPSALVRAGLAPVH